MIAWRLGKQWLIATIIANIMLTIIFSAKLVPMFDLVTTAGEPFYASIFIATDILTEHHGKREGYRSIWMGFIALIMLTLFGQLILLYGTIEESVSVADAMQEVFGLMPRISIAGFTAYLIAQSFDIWLFHFVKDRTGGKMLWLRNNASTLTSMLLDSFIFFPLAFAGSVPVNVLISLIFTGWLFKAPLAFIDTPFLYLSYVIKGKTPPDFTSLRRRKSEPPAAGIR